MSPRRGSRDGVTSLDDVEVVPRYLAGDAACRDDAFAELPSGEWRLFPDERGNCYVTSRLHHVLIAVVPYPSKLVPHATALWQIRARKGLDGPWLWTAAFSDDTPPELIAALAGAVNEDLAEGHEGRQRCLYGNDRPHAVWDILHEAGWYVSADGWHHEATSPDGLVHFCYRSPGARGRRPLACGEAWRIAVLPTPGATRPLWEADFHSATPAHLIAAFTEALVDPRPLTRQTDTVPHAARAFTRPR